MKNRRRVTEEDLLVTEALIAESFSRLRRSVARAPARALGSAGRAVLEHPVASAAAVTAAGILAYGLLRLMTPRRVKEPGGTPGAAVKDAGGRPTLASEILSAAIPLAAPLLADLARSYLGKILAGEPGERDPRGR